MPSNSGWVSKKLVGGPPDKLPTREEIEAAERALTEIDPQALINEYLAQPHAPVEIRLRSRISQEEMDAKVGKVITEGDYNVLIQNDAKVLKPNGDLLCIYLRGAIPRALNDAAYPILTTIRNVTNNRGLASGSKRVSREGSRNSDAAPVMSSIIGYIEPMGGRFPMCRQTAWTGTHTEQFSALYPFMQYVAGLFAYKVPDRYGVQANRAAHTKDEWLIPGTPYTTITVNNTYATGVHQDAGDLKEGFSNLAVLRRGQYTGGVLTFPEFRVGVDLRDGDVILMDAHEWHGNTEIEKIDEEAERISCVFYYRTDILACGTAQEELRKAQVKLGQLL